MPSNLERIGSLAIGTIVMPTASRTSSPKPKPKKEELRPERVSPCLASNDGSRGQVQAEKDKATGRGKVPRRPPGLQSSLLLLYGILAVAVLVFGVIAESMRHQIPSHQFQRRDGSLVNISAFDPIELGPFPRCHDHFGEHLSTNGTWVKNSEVADGPFPPGHPQNPEWLEKVSKHLLDEGFTLKGFQASLHMLVLASVCMFTASKHSVWTFTEPIATSPATFVLEQEDAYWLPVLGSGSLLGMFLVLKYLSIDWVKTLLQLCIVGSCTVGATENFEEFCKFLSPNPSSVRTTILKCIVGLGLALAYVTTKHWILNNIMGLSFCLLGIRHINLSNFRTGVVLLAGLFVYDVPAGSEIFEFGLDGWIGRLNSPDLARSSSIKPISEIEGHDPLTWPFLAMWQKMVPLCALRFWVFFSKPLFGSNVMVSVAKGIEAPMKLMLPRDFGGCGDFKFSMLGLGDIAVPGLFCALLAKWDAVKIAEGSSNGFTYLNIILVMYILSLVTTIAGPPAVKMTFFDHISKHAV
eukprot:s514_g16.t5